MVCIQAVKKGLRIEFLAMRSCIIRQQLLIPVLSIGLPRTPRPGPVCHPRSHPRGHAMMIGSSKIGLPGRVGRSPMTILLPRMIRRSPTPILLPGTLLQGSKAAQRCGGPYPGPAQGRCSGPLKCDPLIQGGPALGPGKLGPAICGGLPSGPPRPNGGPSIRPRCPPGPPNGCPGIRSNPDFGPPERCSAIHLGPIPGPPKPCPPIQPESLSGPPKPWPCHPTGTHSRSSEALSAHPTKLPTSSAKGRSWHGSGRFFGINLTHFLQQGLNLIDLRQGAANQELSGAWIGIYLRSTTSAAFGCIVAAEKLVDRKHGRLRIDYSQADHHHLASVLLHLIQDGPNRGMFGGPGKNDQVVGLWIDVHAHIGFACQQGLQHFQRRLRIGLVNSINLHLNRSIRTIDAGWFLRRFFTRSPERRPCHLIRSPFWSAHPTGSHSLPAKRSSCHLTRSSFRSTETAAKRRPLHLISLSFRFARTTAKRRWFATRTWAMLIKCSG